MRVNARLDLERQRKLEEIARRTGLSVSDILKEAIDVYHERLAENAATARRQLERSGFIGCADGPEDLSETYKAQLAESFERKHDPR